MTIFSAILADAAWQDPTTCPTCDRSGPDSVLDHVRDKLAAFDAVEAASKTLAASWISKGWNQLDDLEKLGVQPEESSLLADAKTNGVKGSLSEEQTRTLVKWVKTLADRAMAKISELLQAKVELEAGLPDKLTAVVEKAEAARRLQANLSDLRSANAKHEEVTNELNHIRQVKEFLDQASGVFATAESNASARRLAASPRLARLCACHDSLPIAQPAPPVPRASQYQHPTTPIPRRTLLATPAPLSLIVIGYQLYRLSSCVSRARKCTTGSKTACAILSHGKTVCVSFPTL